MKKTYKSKFERTIGELYPSLQYEKDKLSYILKKNYVPDWKVKENIYIETKGYFDSEDRAKILAIIEQHPKIQIYLLFQDANKKIHPKSNTTYGDWCKKHNILYSSWKEKKEIPTEWINNVS